MNSFNKRAIFKLSLFPLIALAILLITPLPFYFFLRFAYFYYMPLIVFFSGFAVIFIGAWSGFGAKGYVSNVMKAGMDFDYEDLNYIYKQQLILTLIYGGIGVLYMFIGYLLFLV
jgi:hypothetical protein